MPAQRLGQRIVERRHRQFGDRSRRMPGNCAGLTRMRNAIPTTTRVKKNDKWPARLPPSVARRGSQPAGKPDRLKHARSDSHAEFLIQLANRGKLGCFAGFDLSAGEFPKAPMHRGEMPLLHQDGTFRVDQSHGGDKQGCQKFFQFGRGL